MKHERLTHCIWFVVLLAAGAAIFATGMRIPYYADDYQFVYDRSVHTPVHHYFFHNNPENNFYRPIQASVLLVLQRNFGLDTYPVHILHLALHVLLSWLVFVAMIRLGFSGAQAAIGSLFMLASQANAAAVLNNDTLSQIAGTLFGCLACWFTYLFMGSAPSRGTRTGPPREMYYWISMLALLVSFFSKETSLSFLIVVLALLAVRSRRMGSGWVGAIPRALPAVLVTVFYLVAQGLIARQQAAFGVERYEFHVGANIVRNVGLLLFAASIPLSSVSAFVALKAGTLAKALAALGATAVFAALALAGLRMSRARRGTLALVAAFATVCMFPAVMLNHVSELYAYNIMPFVSILAGAGLGALPAAVRPRRTAGAAAAAAIAILFASHIAAVRGKAALMQDAGETQNEMRTEVESYIARAPEDGELILVNPPKTAVEYSIYLLDGFDALRYAVPAMRRNAGRPDVGVVIVDAMDAESAREVRDGRSLALTLRGGAVIPYGNASP